MKITKTKTPTGSYFAPAKPMGPRLRLGFGFSLGFAFCFRFTLGFGLPLGLEGMSNDGEEEAQIINKQNVGYTYYYYILYHLNW